MAKKQPQSAKNAKAKKERSVDDKTFGLKNKNKSSKVQAFVKQVETQANAQTDKRKQAEAERRAAEKRAAEQAKKEALELFKPVIVQKVPFGVDPKSVLCAYFKQGACTKGNKCKFSHNLEIERKAVKKSLYDDAREEEEAAAKEKDTMDEWDEEKLRKVVSSKHGNPKTTTDIVCKFFIEAVENGKYGWFWTCPNGGDTCKYKHSLPPGFKLKTLEERRLERLAESEKPTITLEEFIETERKKLPQKLTPVTLESFTQWKKLRDERKAEEAAKKAIQAAANKTLSGRQLIDSGKYDNEDDDYTENDTWNMEELRSMITT